MIGYLEVAQIEAHTKENPDPQIAYRYTMQFTCEREEIPSKFEMAQIKNAAIKQNLENGWYKFEYEKGYQFFDFQKVDGPSEE